jgi:hypothetical protein
MDWNIESGERNPYDIARIGFIFLLFPLATGLIGPSLVTSPIPIRVKYNTT